MGETAQGREELQLPPGSHVLIEHDVHKGTRSFPKRAVSGTQQLSEETDLSCITRIQSENGFHQCGLPGTVLSDQSEDMPLFQGKGDIREDGMVSVAFLKMFYS